MIINKLTIKCPFSTSKLPLQLDLSFNIIFLSDKAASPDVRKRNALWEASRVSAQLLRPSPPRPCQ